MRNPLIHYVSNSALTKLKMELNGEFFPPQVQAAFKIGTLVDAFITTPEKVDHDNRIVIGDSRDGTIHIYTPEEMAHAQRMKDAHDSDPFCKMMAEKSVGQDEVFVDRVEFHHGETLVALPMRGKPDLLARGLNMIEDLKTTNCTTQEQFEKSCLKYDYFRQGALYMRLYGINRFILVGISKKNFKVFKVAMEIGDEKFNLGNSSLSHLAYLYHYHKILNNDNHSSAN